jgi:hypothetical protein
VFHPRSVRGSVLVAAEGRAVFICGFDFFEFRVSRRLTSRSKPVSPFQLFVLADGVLGSSKLISGSSRTTRGRRFGFFARTR